MDAGMEHNIFVKCGVQSTIISIHTKSESNITISKCTIYMRLSLFFPTNYEGCPSILYINELKILTQAYVENKKVYEKCTHVQEVFEKYLMLKIYYKIEDTAMKSSTHCL